MCTCELKNKQTNKQTNEVIVIFRISSINCEGEGDKECHSLSVASMICESKYKQTYGNGGEGAMTFWYPHNLRVWMKTNLRQQNVIVVLLVPRIILLYSQIFLRRTLLRPQQRCPPKLRITPTSFRWLF